MLKFANIGALLFVQERVVVALYEVGVKLAFCVDALESSHLIKLYPKVC